MNKALLLILFFNLILLIFSKKISKVYNLFDIPDFKRKIHKYPTPLLGGLFIILNLFLIIFLDNFFFKIFSNNFFQSNQNVILFLLSCLSFYTIGYFDDKYNLSANIKLLLMIIIILVVMFFDDNLLLKNISLTFLKDKIYLKKYSYFVTLLCFLLFINAFNMLDGINGQSASYAIYIFLILIFSKVLFFFSLFIIIILFFFLILNFRNKSYLGDSGSLLIGYLISYIFIKNYNLNLSQNFFADEIFLIMSIPGYELLRLTFKRIIHKQHPFKGDKSHMHHLLINKKFNTHKAYVLIQLLMIFPYTLHLCTKSFFTSFAASIIIYSLFIYKFSKKID
jgi:UDP-GlcNAc:undecaprenyl-phosphate GlcNAc-1-phosphate transferase